MKLFLVAFICLAIVVVAESTADEHDANVDLKPIPVEGFAVKRSAQYEPDVEREYDYRRKRDTAKIDPKVLGTLLGGGRKRSAQFYDSDFDSVLRFKRAPTLSPKTVMSLIEG